MPQYMGKNLVQCQLVLAGHQPAIRYLLGIYLVTHTLHLLTFSMNWAPTGTWYMANNKGKYRPTN